MNMQSLNRLMLCNLHKPAKFSTFCRRIVSLNSINVTDFGITSIGVNNVHKRRYCENTSDKYPTLMEFPYRIWPSVFKSVRNWLTCNLIITPRIDRDFHIKTFIQGSKQAVMAISKAMGSGDLSTLKMLVSSDAYDELGRNLSQFTLSQKQELLFDIDDIYFQFPYEVGLMFDNDNNDSKSVEITMVYHVFRGLQDAKNMTPGDFPISSNPPYKDKLYVLNYRFLREYASNGEDSGWIVNIVNHFKMEDAVGMPPSINPMKK